MLQGSQKGATLASILMIVCIVLVVSMGIASVSCFQLNIALKESCDAKARMAAESVLNLALMQLVRQTDFGKNGQPMDWIDRSMGATSLISFTQGAAPYSTYNYYNSNAVPGWNGRQVPAEAIHLIATGTCSARAKSMEIIVKKGLFPYAMATTSKIQSINAPLWAEGVKNTTSLLSGTKDLPGNINSNYSGAGNAIEAPKNSYVTGKVSAPGAISVKMPSTILGGICPSSQPVDMPFISTNTLDPKDQVGVIPVTTTSLSGMSMDTIYRAADKLTVYGDLELKNGLLFTEGDLVVTGRITGNGALISKGGVTIGNTSTLAAANQLAIVADKDVTVAGQGSYLQGMVYTHGNFYGENFTLVGNLIAQSSDENLGQAVLHNVTLISNQQSSDLTITSPVYGGEAGGNKWENTKVEAFYSEAPGSLTEQFDIRFDSSQITNVTAFKNALTAAINNFTPATAAALDAQGGPKFYLVCNNLGNVTPNVLEASLAGLAAKITPSSKITGYLDGINNNGVGTDIPLTLDLNKVIKGLLTTIKNKVDSGQVSGILSGTSVVTDLRLNKYVTNVLPTRITFQGEIP